MPKQPRLKVTKESPTGRNEKFRDTKTNQELKRTEVVKKIENGPYQKDYHIRVINGVKTPVSNPDGTKNNNLD